MKAAFHDTDTDSPDTPTFLRPTRAISCKLFMWQAERGSRPTRRHPRDDPREDVGVGVVECGLHRTRPARRTVPARHAWVVSSDTGRFGTVGCVHHPTSAISLFTSLISSHRI